LVVQVGVSVTQRGHKGSDGTFKLFNAVCLGAHIVLLLIWRVENVHFEVAQLPVDDVHAVEAVKTVTLTFRDFGMAALD
jgi:hypothetical protein